MFSSAANNFDIATGGTVRINVNGNITKISDILDTTVVRRQVQNSSVHLAGGNATNDGANIALYGSSHSSQANNIQFRASATNTMKLDSSGRLLIGTTSSREIGSFTSALQISGSTNNASSFSILNNVNDANPALILLAKQRSGSVGGTTIVQDGDEVGAIRFIACDGSDIAHRVAQISCDIDGSPSANDLPARLVFKTTPDSSTSALERMSINNAGGVLIGVEADSIGGSARAKLSIDCDDINAVSGLGDASNYGLVFLNSPTTGQSNGIGFFNDSGSTCGGAILHQDSGSGNIGHLIFYTSATSDTPLERLRIENDGDIGVGVSSPDGRFHIMGGNLSGAGSVTANTSGNLLVLESNTSQGMSILTANDERATIFFGTTGTNGNQEASIQYAHESVSTANDRRAMIFKVGGNNERVRINSTGLLINRTTQNDDELFSIFTDSTTPEMINLRNNAASSTKDMITMMHVKDSGTVHFMRFKRTGGLNNVGGITTEASSTAFNTSSDYRLKENEVPISDGITRLKTLKPYRFNFKITPEKTVDGFFAHEVTAVPEAITGEKDAVETTYYKDGDTIPEGKSVGDIRESDAIVPQSLDYSKLTPLLTAALQEAIAKIEVLETKVAALEAA